MRYATVTTCMDCGRVSDATRCRTCAKRNRPARSTIRNTGTSSYRRMRARALERDGYRCVYCGAQATEVDHVLPVSKGGTNDLGNLRASCRRCNRSKGARVLPAGAKP